MPIDEERPRLTGSGERFRVHAPDWVGRLLALAASGVVLVVAVAFSLMLFAVALATLLLVWGYVWWKTRELRKRIRERPSGGRVIEGEVIRDAGSDVGLGR
jgi:O-antigen/teichoic acid export membrane protein